MRKGPGLWREQEMNTAVGWCPHMFARPWYKPRCLSGMRSVTAILETVLSVRVEHRQGCKLACHYSEGHGTVC